VNIPGKSIFYVSCGIALTAIAVFVFNIANSASVPPLEIIRPVSSRWVNQWDEEQVRELVMDQQKGTIRDE
jgi:hypothetical protein